MTGVMGQRHLANGASILEKALEFTAFATPKVASDLRSPKDHAFSTDHQRPQLTTYDVPEHYLTWQTSWTAVEWRAAGTTSL
jgi:hypothetical protein